MGDIVKPSSGLPTNYEAARTAIAACSRTDECQDWADKAAAMESYARQADDETLFSYARRIKARAIRRGGELLKLVKPATGAHRKTDGADTLSRKQVAADAGLSERQKVTMLRVATVPQPDFDAQVESDHPPTITALAAQGTSHLGNSTAAQYRAATHALADLHRFAEFARRTPAREVALGVKPFEVEEARTDVSTVDAWLDLFVTSLGDSIAD